MGRQATMRHCFRTRHQGLTRDEGSDSSAGSAGCGMRPHNQHCQPSTHQPAAAGWRLLPAYCCCQHTDAASGSDGGFDMDCAAYHKAE